MKKQDSPVATILEVARQCSTANERESYLDEACKDDLALRNKIESMLEASDRAEAFFDTESDPPAIVNTPIAEGPGTHIGRYKLLQQIGEGGFGIVYMAEQQEPVVRKVALKIIKPGMDTKQVVARFESERQALALMDHANIAKVLDGGATDSGRPYFVMELVSGIPITKFCDEHSYNTQDRLLLFKEVCVAIQHAHQKGIIHRDIKPSNVLVTLHGDNAVPKVIDFGIAKATHQRLTDKTLFTQFQQFIGTPAYMSPEQASLSGLDIDTRSDVYSLGVLLYELLVGTPPFDAKNLLSKGYDEIRRIIREEDAPRPSTRLNTLSDEEKTQATKHRGSDFKDLCHILTGDLDRIVMKSLEKDRTRRYETANSLSDDIGRFLNHEPVTAVAPSNLYMLKKFAYRNRTTLSTTAAFGIVLVFTSAISIYQAYRANEANLQLASQLTLTAAAHSQSQQSEQRAIQHERQATRNLEAAWLDRGRQYFIADNPQLGLAWYAWAARSNPTNKILVDNLVAALTQNQFPKLAIPEMKHEGNVNKVTYSPDGQKLVTASFDHSAKLWDSKTGDLIGSPMMHDDAVWDAIFSLDGKFVLSRSSDDTGRLWEASSGVPLHLPFRHDDEVNAIAFSPDSQKAATGSDDRSISIWSTETGRKLASLDGHQNAVTAIAFSPDGKKILTGGKDNRVLFWDSTDYRREVRSLEFDTNVRSIDFDSQGDFLAIRLANTLRIFDARTLLPRTPVLEHSYNVDGIFHPNGTTYVTASFLALPRPGQAGTSIIWETEQGRQAGHTLRHPVHPLRSVEYSPDGHRILTSGYDRTARLWDPITGHQLGPSLQHPAQLSHATFSPDGQHLATACADNSARIWKATLLTPALQGFLGDPNTHQFTPNAHSIVSSPEQGGIVQFWNLSDENLRGRRLDHKNRSHVRASGFSPDGRHLTTNQEDGMASVWDLTTGERVGEPLKDNATIFHAKYDPSNKYVVTHGASGTVKIWDANTLKLLANPDQQDGDVLSLKFSSDGSRFATATRRETVYIIDTNTGRTIGAPIRHNGKVSMVFSAGRAQFITACADGFLRGIDAQTARISLGPVTCNSNGFPIDLSPDGNLLAVPTKDGSLGIFNAIDFTKNGPSLPHHAHIHQVYFTPNGKRLIVKLDTDRGAIQVWDVQSRLPIGPPFNHDIYTEKVHTSADSQFIMARKDHKTVIYELADASLPAAETLFDLAEAIAERRITTASGTLENVSYNQKQQLEKQIRQANGETYYDRLLSWLVTNPSSRTLTPSSKMTYDDFATLLLEQNTRKSLKTILRSSPDNGIAFAKLALLELTNPEISPTQLRHANHYVSQAQRWAPTAYETFLSAAELEAAKGNHLEALTQIETGIPLDSSNPDGWHLKSRILFKLNRKPEAELASQTADQLNEASKNN